MPGKQYVWFDGRFVAYEDAKVHVLTHSLQYGSGIFEGIRAYKTAMGPAVFRLKDHIKRFLNTVKIYDMNLGFTQSQIEHAITDLVKKNGLQECYIRPFAFYNSQRLGVNPIGNKVSLVIIAIPFGEYLQNKDNGIKCKVATWQRINSSILPVEAKASGNYLNSALTSLEARKAGADEAILLSHNGYVAEGPGENIFLIQDNVLVTPPKSADILVGITRNSVIQIAEKKGIEVEERNVHREELYTSDEVFFTGTAAEISPIIEIDLRKIGSGKIGPITKIFLDAYSDITHGRGDDFGDWLTYVK